MARLCTWHGDQDAAITLPALFHDIKPRGTKRRVPETAAVEVEGCGPVTRLRTLRGVRATFPRIGVSMVPYGESHGLRNTLRLFASHAAESMEPGFVTLGIKAIAVVAGHVMDAKVVGLEEAYVPCVRHIMTTRKWMEFGAEAELITTTPPSTSIRDAVTHELLARGLLCRLQLLAFDRRNSYAFLTSSTLEDFTLLTTLSLRLYSHVGNVVAHADVDLAVATALRRLPCVRSLTIDAAHDASVVAEAAPALTEFHVEQTTYFRRPHPALRRLRITRLCKRDRVDVFFAEDVAGIYGSETLQQVRLECVKLWAPPDVRRMLITPVLSALLRIPNAQHVTLPSMRCMYDPEVPFHVAVRQHMTRCVTRYGTYYSNDPRDFENVPSGMCIMMPRAYRVPRAIWIMRMRALTQAGSAHAIVHASTPAQRAMAGALALPMPDFAHLIRQLVCGGSRLV